MSSKSVKLVTKVEVRKSWKLIEVVFGGGR